MSNTDQSEVKQDPEIDEPSHLTFYKSFVNVLESQYHNKPVTVTTGHALFHRVAPTTDNGLDFTLKWSTAPEYIKKLWDESVGRINSRKYP